MADKSKDVKAPDFLRELMQKGQESLKELSGLVEDLSKQDWRMTTLREEGMKRVVRLREQSEDLGVATRKQVVKQIERLSKELGRLARRIDVMGRASKRHRRPTTRAPTKDK